MLVELPGHKGIGKLESAADGRCWISIFHSVQRTQAVDCASSELRRAYLSPQTRAYVQDDDRMRVGRVTGYLQQENGLITYEIRFPNGRQRDVGEVDLFVRPWNAPEDPAEILAAGGAESQFLHDRRQVAQEQLGALTASAQGLTSLLSAGIDFVPHQVAAVRRVLNDPIQRYLLADEVGLGKTVEAGLVIRQHLIDNPGIEVLVVTPPALCGQWRSELREKLRLDQFGEPFECLAHADLAGVKRIPDVLIVDEAHHLVGSENDALSKARLRLRELAASVPVLLLLSATPPLGDEERFLALLNLLDPLTHRLDDLEGFRLKLKQRRSVGRLLLSLNPETPGLVLRQRGAELERSFPDDPFVREFAPKLVTATREAPDQLPALCTALKEHVADSYRIHQRLIRSRRADAQGWEFRSRGPAVSDELSLSHVRVEGDPSNHMADLTQAVEDWRTAATEALIGAPDARRALTLRYRSMLEAIAEGAEGFRDWLADTPPLFAGEDEILAALSNLTSVNSDDGRSETMIESVRRLIKALRADTGNPKIAVFASATSVAIAFHSALQHGLATSNSYLLVDGGDGAVAAFRGDVKGAILVVDRSAEEGLNLSFADAIVHLDLPMNAARIEQRIGRLDRYGRRQTLIRHRIFLPSDEGMTPWAAWYELLATGLLIFHRSISDVQFLLEAFEDEAFGALFISGADALLPLAAIFRVRVGEERKSQDEQYALDRTALFEDPVEPFIRGLEDAEADENALEAAVDAWYVGVLQLKRRPFAWPVEDPFKFSLARETLIPRVPWQQLLEIEDGDPLTWKRQIATRDGQVTLLRPGTPLVDIISRFTRWDDRGTAFITLRHVDHWSADPWVGFKLCFTIEPDLKVDDLLAPSLSELAAARRAQRYLPIRRETLYVDINGAPVVDAAILAHLSIPYNKDRKKAGFDINLGSRPQLFAEYIDPAVFPGICRRVRDGARSALEVQPDYAAAQAAAVRLAMSDLDRRKSRLVRRQSAGDTMARADITLIEATLPGIAAPAIRLEAMGCFVLDQRRPVADRHG